MTTGGVMLAVRFTRPFQVYMPGDVASFPEAMARQIVAGGAATRVNIGRGPAPEGGRYAFRYPVDLHAQVNK
jgi:hypothetical protein